MSKYEITPIESFFQPTRWSDDLKTSFGLHPTVGSWPVFKRSIEVMSANCAAGECIKVVFLARHGHGLHNKVHEKFPCWEAAKKADTPHDAELSPCGIIQGFEVAATLQREAARGMPLPDKWFVSSLRRTGDTCGLEWGWLFAPGPGAGGPALAPTTEHSGGGVPATVIEELRESISGGIHNSRFNKSKLQAIFPSFTFLPEMTEVDELWKPETWDKEDQELMIKRLEKGFEQCLDMSEGSTYISITSHKTAAERLRMFLGLSERTMELGEMNILVLKVKKVGERVQ